MRAVPSRCQPHCDQSASIVSIAPAASWASRARSSWKRRFARISSSIVKVIFGAGIPSPKITFTIDEEMRANLRFQLDRAREAHEAAGAIDTIEADWSQWGWHLLGTARMGDDPKTSVVDRWCAAHDVPNL